MVFFRKFLVDCFCTRYEDNLGDPHSYGINLELLRSQGQGHPVPYLHLLLSFNFVYY